MALTVLTVLSKPSGAKLRQPTMVLAILIKFLSFVVLNSLLLVQDYSQAEY